MYINFSLAQEEAEEKSNVASIMVLSIQNIKYYL